MRRGPSVDVVLVGPSAGRMGHHSVMIPGREHVRKRNTVRDRSRREAADQRPAFNSRQPMHVHPSVTHVQDAAEVVEVGELLVEPDRVEPGQVVLLQQGWAGRVDRVRKHVRRGRCGAAGGACRADRSQPAGVLRRRNKCVGPPEGGEVRLGRPGRPLQSRLRARRARRRSSGRAAPRVRRARGTHRPVDRQDLGIGGGVTPLAELLSQSSGVARARVPPVPPLPAAGDSHGRADGSTLAAGLQWSRRPANLLPNLNGMAWLCRKQGLDLACPRRRWGTGGGAVTDGGRPPELALGVDGNQELRGGEPAQGRRGAAVAGLL
mmetsp:Transcript_42384/g.132127  ORF Transcript_42384/g.132127 Transcript_42384/m.132127 type:complete len:321 (+) Transcript_42384:1436-2398(+)